MPASKKVVPEDNVNSGALETRKCSSIMWSSERAKVGTIRLPRPGRKSEESSEAGCASINTWNILGQPGVMGHRLTILFAPITLTVPAIEGGRTGREGPKNEGSPIQMAGFV